MGGDWARGRSGSQAVSKGQVHGIPFAGSELQQEARKASLASTSQRQKAECCSILHANPHSYIITVTPSLHNHTMQLLMCAASRHTTTHSDNHHMGLTGLWIHVAAQASRIESVESRLQDNVVVESNLHRRSPDSHDPDTCSLNS